VTEVGFYHLQATTLEKALGQLCERVLANDRRAVVRAASAERVEALNRALWLYGRDSFLPHGSAEDGHAEHQPIYLTEKEDEVPNGATVLILVDGADAPDLDRFERCLYLFDGRDEDAVRAARERWRKLRGEGHALTYWRQNERGGWGKVDPATTG
jgi:DNA polymerase III subunit chi